MKRIYGVLSVLLMASIIGCTSDKVSIADYGSRIDDLEKRAELNEQLDQVQSQLIQANSDAIALETQLRIDGDALIQSMIAQEAASRESGDEANANALQTAIVVQTIVNLAVQAQIYSINSKFPLINFKLQSLQSQVNSTNADLNSLEAQVSSLNSASADLQARMLAAEGDISALESSVQATQAQLDQEGVKLYKCNSSSSTERIFKINGKFYAVMNRVTTETVSVVTGTTSETFSTPDLCETFLGTLELPNSGGNCTPMSGPFKSTKIPGTTVTVQANSTQDVTLVKSVKMAMDLLKDGSYATTDGGPSCSFSISNSGTQANNLIPVQ